MKKLAIAFAAVILYTGAAFAGEIACEGDDTAVDGPACGVCDAEPSGTTGCLALSGDPGYICAGGDATTGQGCIAADDGSGGGVFACSDADGVTVPCDEAGCRAAAEAACAAAM